MPMDPRVGAGDVDTRRTYTPDTSAQFTAVTEDSNSKLPTERFARCAPYTMVMGANLGNTTLGRPTGQVNHLTVMVQSPALLRNGSAASYAVLKAADDAAQKKQEDDANRRAAPKL